MLKKKLLPSAACCQSNCDDTFVFLFLFVYRHAGDPIEKTF
jgi:hypothetical protein